MWPVFAWALTAAVTRTLSLLITGHRPCADDAAASKAVAVKDREETVPIDVVESD